MSWERYGGSRAAVAQLAAQIMYGEGIKQYFTAKRMAARRLFGRERDLPSNGEIKEALLDLVIEIEGEGRTQRLFTMRIVALETLEALATFHPRLIGSVATGHVRSGSDIDLHVFAWHAADVEARVKELGWTYETERVTILKHGENHEFHARPRGGHLPDRAHGVPAERARAPPAKQHRRQADRAHSGHAPAEALRKGASRPLAPLPRRRRDPDARRHHGGGGRR